MTKEKILFIILTAVVIIGLTVTGVLVTSRQPAQPLAALSSNQGGCSQCIAGNCYSAPCNLECRLVGDGCETIVMGGGQFAYEPATKESGGDYCEFFIQRVTKNNAAMAAAGVAIGDTIVSINDIYAGSDLEFAKLVLTLPRGTVLTVWRNGERRLITL